MRAGATRPFRRTQPRMPSWADARTAGRAACACVMSDPPRVRHLGPERDARAARRAALVGGSAGDRGGGSGRPLRTAARQAYLYPPLVATSSASFWHLLMASSVDSDAEIAAANSWVHLVPRSWNSWI